MRKAPPRRKSEPTIALINVVFLMLVFFMVASTLSPPLEGALKLVSTEGLEGREPPDALVIMADGELRYRGATVPDALAYFEAQQNHETARIIPDRSAPAAKLLEAARTLKAAGAGKVMIVTEKALQ